MQNQKITFTNTANIFTQGNPNAKNVWIVLHGYGQKANDLISLFPTDNNSFIISPEAPSQFYTKGKQHKPVSSWMTSRFRDDAITNNMNYLDKISEVFNLKTKGINILGFSQGSETASRWAAEDTIKINSLILWSGRLAPETSLSKFNSTTTIRQIIGSDDNWIKPENTLKNNVEYFKGGHEINKELISQLIKF